MTQTTAESIERIVADISKLRNGMWVIDGHTFGVVEAHLVAAEYVGVAAVELQALAAAEDHYAAALSWVAWNGSGDPDGAPGYTARMSVDAWAATAKLAELVELADKED